MPTLPDINMAGRCTRSLNLDTHTVDMKLTHMVQAGRNLMVQEVEEVMALGVGGATARVVVEVMVLGVVIHMA